MEIYIHKSCLLQQEREKKTKCKQGIYILLIHVGYYSEIVIEDKQTLRN